MTLRLGVLADLHASLDPAESGSWWNPYDFAGMLERVDDALAWFAGEGADAVALAGDLTHRGDGAALDALLARCIAASELPLRAVAGNHDVGDGCASLADALVRTGADAERFALAQPAGERRGGVRLAGVQVASSVNWLQARLAAPPDVPAWGPEPVVLVSHYPLLSHALVLTEQGLAHPGDLVGRAAVAQALTARTAPTVVVSGHVHVRAVATDGSVLQLTQSALIEPPFDAALVELDINPDGVLHVTRRTRRAGTARAAYEPELAAADGAWRFDGVRWAPVPGSQTPASGMAAHSSREASRAPSTSEPSLAQAMSGSTGVELANVAKPQSVPAITFSRPTTLA